MANPDEIIDKQKSLYQKNFLEHGDSPEGTYQNNQITQHLRFKSLVEDILLMEGENHFTVHDIGSGISDMYAYLKNIPGIHFTYSGTEIVDEMVVLSAKKYPEIKIHNRDFLVTDPAEKYDYVVLSGTFNIPGEISPEEWKKFIFSMVSRMFLHANKGIAFNFLTTYKTLTNPDLYYVDPKEIFDFCSTNLSRFVSLKANYPLYEVSCVTWKKEFLHSKHADPALEKYFK
jgi:hypothetical protein